MKEEAPLETGGFLASLNLQETLFRELYNSWNKAKHLKKKWFWKEKADLAVYEEERGVSIDEAINTLDWASWFFKRKNKAEYLRGLIAGLKEEGVYVPPSYRETLHAFEWFKSVDKLVKAHLEGSPLLVSKQDAYKVSRCLNHFLDHFEEYAYE